MKFSVVGRAGYHQQYGGINTRSSQETLELWARIQKMPVDHYLIIDPEPGEEIKKLRAALYTRVRKFAIRAGVEVRFVVNREEQHLVVYKQAKTSK